MKLLISLCNRNAFPDREMWRTSLLELNLDNRELLPIELPFPGTGATGIARYRNGILVALQGAPSRLVLLGRDYTVEETWDLELAQDVHSIAICNNRIYLASTGTDAVVEFDPDNGEQVYWAGSSSVNDTIHLNSITCFQNQLYATAFGPKKSKLWLDQDPSGYLINLTTSVKTMTALRHPHSLGSSGDHMYFCESQNQMVRCSNASRLPITQGYPRGLVQSDTHLFVGASRIRKWSRSRGEPIIHSEKRGECSLLVFRYEQHALETSALIERISLEHYAEEIYDLLLLESP